jgi:hypothetical protein
MFHCANKVVDIIIIMLVNIDMIHYLFHIWILQKIIYNNDKINKITSIECPKAANNRFMTIFTASVVIDCLFSFLTSALAIDFKIMTNSLYLGSVN